MTLGKLILLLSEMPQDDHVAFDFGYATPTTVDSYRGYYDELALGFDGSYGASLTVGALLKDLNAAVGKTFTGWKGGDYQMHEDTPVHVANPGNTSDTEIIHVRKGGYFVLLETVSEP